MTPIYIIASNTVRQTIRQRLFFNIAIFAVGMLLLSMVLAQLTFGFPDRVVRSIGLSALVVALDLIALFVSVGLIHQEIDKRTLFVVLTRPVRRWQYVAGRYLGLLCTLALTLVGFGLVYFIALVLDTGRPTTGDLFALGGALVEAAILAAIGTVFSAFSTPTLSGGIGLGIWLCSTATDDLLRLTERADDVTRAVAEFAYYALPCLHRLNFREAAIYQLPVGLGEYAAALAYGGLYAFAVVLLACAILSRREMI